LTIISRNKLNEEELKDIETLAGICNAHDDLTLKINPGMLKSRSGENSDDFLCYLDEKLVGFLGLYGFGKDEIEMSGMVHPDYRKKGIFTELFKAASKEISNRKIGRLLIICENKSKSAAAFALSKGAEYSFSEYYMELESNTNEVALKGFGITLRLGTEDDIESIKKQDSIYFDIPIDNIDDDFIVNRLDNTYIAELDGKIIGKINISTGREVAFISGFGVLPEYRCKGYGREILGLALLEGRKLVNGKAALEVAAKNKNALNLYLSYGFKEITGYDYYQIEY
jgi:GNAT superfamily N-acetyltransferase